MATPKFTGKYAKIRADIYKGTIGSKFEPKDYSNWGSKYGYGQLAGGNFYKSERGYYAAMKKIFDKDMALLDEIEKVSIPLEMEIVIDWTRGSTMGPQAQASMRYSFIENGSVRWDMAHGERTGGWGYDKESTQVANVFNKVPSTMKILCNARVGTKPFGYGAVLNKGKPWLPHWESGVGLTSYISTLRGLGYETRSYHSKSSDTYVFTLKKKPKA